MVIEPYVGARPFGPGDASRFFGRARETWELTSKIRNHRLVVVHGRPGSGKTSLLMAGVLPALGDKAHVLPVVSLASPSAPPMPPPDESSEESVNPVVLGLLSGWAPDRSAAQLRELTLAQYLVELTDSLDEGASRRLPLVAVVDRFDGLLRDHPDIEPARAAFLDQLAEAAEAVDDLHLVLVMGSDVVHKMTRHEIAVSGTDSARYEVRPLEPADAVQAVEGPIEATGRSFAPAVAGQLVDRLRTTVVTDDVGETRTAVAPAVDPTSLQVVCSALWRRLTDDVVVITAQHLQAHGDVETVTTDFCVHAAVDVAAREEIPIRRIWEWLATTFVTDRGTPATAYEGLLETAGMPNSVAHALEERRILGTEERSGAVWFELRHAGLVEPLRHGRRLADWLAALAGPELSPATYLQVAQGVLQAGMVRLAEECSGCTVVAARGDVKTLAEAKSFLGNLVLRQGRTESGARADQLYAVAESSLRDAAELFETEQDSSAVGRALASLGRLLMERGRVADALGELRSALDRLRGDVEVRLDFARALDDAGQRHAALGEYTAVLTLSPENVEALVGRGTINAQYGRSAAARRDLDAAVRLDPRLTTRDDVAAARLRAERNAQNLA